MTRTSAARRREIERGFAVDLGRAAGGAVVFALPVLMTQEMWALGAGLDRFRLLALFAGVLPLLVGLSHYIGFQETETWVDDVRDAFVAVAVGFTTSAVVLTLFGILHRGLSLDEITGAVAIQTVASSFGAIIAQGQLGQSDDQDDANDQSAGYWGDLMFMATGAIFLSLNVAPTEEVTLIAAQMTPYHVVLLAAATIAVMHAIVYGVRFVGQSARRPEGAGFLSLFVRRTLAGYVVALGVAAIMLWIFGTLDGLGGTAALRHVVVLGFPASVGAAFARVIVGGQQ